MYNLLWVDSAFEEAFDLTDFADSIFLFFLLSSIVWAEFWFRHVEGGKSVCFFIIFTNYFISSWAAWGTWGSTVSDVCNLWFSEETCFFFLTSWEGLLRYFHRVLKPEFEWTMEIPEFLPRDCLKLWLKLLFINGIIPNFILIWKLDHKNKLLF